MSATPTAATRLFLLLGDPVEQSLSPVFQNAAIRALDIDAFYAALRCDRTSIGPLVRALCRADGGGNVTTPHKMAAAECVERPSAAVKRTGVCNTFWGEAGVVCGDNTDVAGFAHAASLLLPRIEGIDSLIIGAGGAAAAAACALVDAGAASITIINRSPDRARLLVDRLDARDTAVRVCLSARDLAGVSLDLVVNASAVGMQTDQAPAFDLAAPARVRAALDIVYRPGGATPFVRQARRLGIKAADGTEMLLAQGAAAFSRWFDVDPPLDLMRDSLAGH